MVSGACSLALLSELPGTLPAVAVRTSTKVCSPLVVTQVATDSLPDVCTRLGSHGEDIQGPQGCLPLPCNHSQLGSCLQDASSRGNAG